MNKHTATLLANAIKTSEGKRQALWRAAHTLTRAGVEVRDEEVERVSEEWREATSELGDMLAHGGWSVGRNWQVEKGLI
jgi:hypothetical protein